MEFTAPPQQTIHHPLPVPPHEHGPMYWLVEHVPGGEWTVLGLVAFGAGSLAFLKFRKTIVDWMYEAFKRRQKREEKDK